MSTRVLRGRATSGERGQIIVWAMFVMGLLLFGVAGFVIDTGRIYLAYEQLQASTDAAALAGGYGLPLSATAISDAEAYGSESSGKNVYPNLSNVTMATPTVKCISYTYVPIPCATAAGTYNVIQVQQSVTIPMTLAKFFGASSQTLTATATAQATGSLSTPYNIALIIDTTASMGSANSDSCTDPTNSEQYTTSIACALVGAKILLLNTAPCADDLTTCPGTTSNSVDMVSLFTFPNGEASTMSNDYTGSCNGPTITSSYSFPDLNTTYAPSGTASDYQVTSFLADYRTSDSASTLNSSSDLTAAIGQKSGCAGLQTPGGLGTYYAGALAAAQDTVVAQQALAGREGSQNAIILLSDGQANATKMATKDLNGNTVSTTAYTYPSTINQCQQAINVASSIKAAGTTIYTVAYGSPSTTSSKSSGCETDSSGPNAWISPCTTMKDIASSAETFFVDNPSGTSSGCTSSENPETGLAQIFGAIAGSFSKARLIPNSVINDPTA